MSLETEPVLEGGLPPAVLTPAPAMLRRFVKYRDQQPRTIEEEVITEIRFSIFVDGEELVSLMCSPWKLRELVIGFLAIEGFIEGPEDIQLLRVCLEDRLAEVTLRDRSFTVPAHKILTSGCTGGQTFGKYLAEIERFRVEHSLSISPEALYRLMRQLYSAAELYGRAGGVHTSVLADPDQVLVVGEDIGRHNTLDKILGECLLRGIGTHGRLIMASGRISSEMLIKAALMGAPLVASRTSPTDLAITLAERLNITTVGYIRSGSLNVYSHPWRVTGG